MKNSLFCGCCMEKEFIAKLAEKAPRHAKQATN